jgi:hypothetical protein
LELFGWLNNTKLTIETKENNMFDLKWEVGVLLDCYAHRAANLYDCSYDERRKLKNLYSQAIMLNIKNGYGLFYPIDDFIDEVNGGSYNDYDGAADLLDADGNVIEGGCCDVEFLEEAKANGAVYVAWFNK